MLERIESGTELFETVPILARGCWNVLECVGMCWNVLGPSVSAEGGGFWRGVATHRSLASCSLHTSPASLLSRTSRVLSPAPPVSLASRTLPASLTSLVSRTPRTPRTSRASLFCLRHIRYLPCQLWSERCHRSARFGVKCRNVKEKTQDRKRRRG
jgi:hypothetical protein